MALQGNRVTLIFPESTLSTLTPKPSMKKLLLSLTLSLLICAPLFSQTYVNLDFSGTSYTVNNRPIGSTGVTYSMERVVDVNSGTPNPIGYPDGSLSFEANCANCGPTIRITFSQPVSLLISGKTTGGSWFGNDGLFTVSSNNGALTLADPNNELTGITTAPNQVTFNGTAACNGVGPTPCQNWSVSSPSITSLDVNFTADQLNGTALRFRIDSVLPPLLVPTMSQWGLILLALSILSVGVTLVWRRKNALQPVREEA